MTVIGEGIFLLGGDIPNFEVYKKILAADNILKGFTEISKNIKNLVFNIFPVKDLVIIHCFSSNKPCCLENSPRCSLSALCERGC